MADLIKSGELAQRIKDLPSGVMPEILAHAPVGSTVTCSNGEITLTEIAIDGTCVFKIPMFGVWTVIGNHTENVLVDTIKRYEANVKSILPDEYQQLEYIESTGTQYIDTKILPDLREPIKTEFKCAFMSYPADKQNTIFGGQNNRDASGSEYQDSIYGFWYDNRVSPPSLWMYARKTSGPRPLSIPKPEIGTIINVKTSLISGEKIVTNIDGIVYEDTNAIEESVYPINCSLYLFGFNYKNALDKSSYSNARLVNFRYDDSKIIMNLIPCYEKSTGTEGMYDTVSKTFLTNKGTGKFIRGPEVH